MSHSMLHTEQEYVPRIAKRLGIETRILHHESPTNTCDEKLDLLKQDHRYTEWTIDRMIKALYFTNNGQPFIGIITPESRTRIKQKNIFSKTLGISRTQAEDYYLNSQKVPKGMKVGTCTPFPLTSSIGTEIRSLIVVDVPGLRGKLVDISIGGEDKESQMRSMHLPYEGIYEILKRQFKDKVHLYQTT